MIAKVFCEDLTLQFKLKYEPAFACIFGNVSVHWLGFSVLEASSVTGVFMKYIAALRPAHSIT